MPMRVPAFPRRHGPPARSRVRATAGRMQKRPMPAGLLPRYLRGHIPVARASLPPWRRGPTACGKGCAWASTIMWCPRSGIGRRGACDERIDEAFELRTLRRVSQRDARHVTDDPARADEDAVRDERDRLARSKRRLAA